MHARQWVLRSMLFFCGALPLAAAASSGVADAQSLVIGVGAAVTSIDPHFHNLTPNNSLAANIFEPLVDRDAQARLKPCLAESWRQVDERTWDFRLRDVAFQDGHRFTAEDVKYSLERVPRVPNSPSSFAAYTSAISGIEIIDPHTIRLHTTVVYPLLPADLSQVLMVEHRDAGDATTADFNSGKAAIGTGPFRFVSFKPGDRIELARNDDWWGGKPSWSSVTFRMISNDAARTAALLARDVQFIDSVPTSDAARLRADADVTLAETVSLRLVFLSLDQSRDGPSPFVTGPDGEALDRNPMKDRRVREALSLAINRPAIVQRVMEDQAVVSGQFLPAGAYSYVDDLPPPPFDAARARQLLAEAGYPRGLRITLHGPNDRYVNDAAIIQAVGQMWSRIGVQTTVEALPWSSFIGHANKQDYSSFLVGWGSASGEASNPLRALVASFDAQRGFGAANRGRYHNAEVDALLGQALATSDDAARETLLQRATRVAMEDVAIIPLHLQKSIWAMRRGLTYTPRADEETRAWDIRPAP